jgi:hypothetical protein
MGLVVLAIVTRMIGAADRGATFSPVSIAAIVAKATVFVAVALFLGVLLSPKLFNPGHPIAQKFSIARVVRSSVPRA